MPFSGIHSRRTCRLHDSPARTGQPLSQNFSFYGASICQGYDCRAKESEEQAGHQLYSDFLEINFPDYYHRLICDAPLFTLLESIPGFPHSVSGEGHPVPLLRSLIELRLEHRASKQQTSFQPLMVRPSDRAASIEALFELEHRQEAGRLLALLTELKNDFTVSSREP